MLSPVETEAVIGEVEVRALFRVSRLGTIAGCMVTSGVVRRGANVRIFREGARIHETTVAQLRRFKDDVREVTEGFECGILLEGFNDLREGDIFEVYETREVERTSLDEPAPAAAVAAPTPTSPERGLRRDPRGRAPLPGGGLAQGQAQARALGEGAAPEPLRRVGGRGRPPRALAALRADGGLRRPRRARGRGAGRAGRAWLAGQEWELVRSERTLVSPED